MIVFSPLPYPPTIHPMSCSAVRPDVPFAPLAPEVHTSRELQQACEGFWYIIPAGEKYPVFAVRL